MEQSHISKRLNNKHNNLHVHKKPTHHHPLLFEVILEKVFGYLKGLNNATTLAKYRTTCKVWDQEIAKLLRKDTQINLTTILAPYPDGMGWTASPGNSEVPGYYDVPYSEVRSFENVLVIMNSCENFTNPKWRNWFEMMGSRVKGLCFSSPFNCFCQNRFLEYILKDWCPNLESLELCNVNCIGSLLLMSSFRQTDKTLICEHLKILKISIDGQEPYSICDNNSGLHPDVVVMDIRIKNLAMQVLTDKLVDIIYAHGLNSGNYVAFPEIVNMSKDQFEREDLPDLSNELASKLDGTDGGIVGQLMRDINVEKLEIRNLTNLISYNENFASFFHLRPNRWRLSLRELDLSEIFAKSIEELHVIAQVKFPLTSFKLGGIHSRLYDDEMTRILSYFTDTLEHLEIRGRVVQKEVFETPSKLILPSLPKLKSFVHENICACSLSADNLWKSAPNLITVSLKGGSNMVWSAKRFFKVTSAISSNAMKELRLSAPINGKQAETILDWFPNLLKVEMVLKNLGVNSYKFFEKLEKSKVEHLKIDILGLLHPNHNMFENDKTVALWKPSNIKGLKSLELNNVANLSFRLTPEPFALAELTSLKLINFRICIHQKKEIMSKLSHIPSIELVNPVYLKRCPTRSEASLKKKI